MTPRERVIRALTFNRPDRAPRDLWSLPGIGMFRSDEQEHMRELYPPDIGGPGLDYGRGFAERGEPSRRGSYTDEWGCTFAVYEDGVIGEVRRPPLSDWSGLESLRPPREILDVDWSAADRTRDDRFILAGTSIRPFERMRFLRGTENLLMDLASGEARALKVRSIVHEFYLEELSHWVERDVDGISFADDWGTQSALLADIIPDLVEIDRQRVLPFGTTDDVRAAVRRVRRVLDDGSGGTIALCAWGLRDPFENISAVFEEWQQPCGGVP
jgi:hypothetical protein